MILAPSLDTKAPHSSSLARPALCCTYNSPSVNPNNEVEPRFQRDLLIRVSQDLEAVRSVDRGLRLINRRSVEPRDEAVQGAKETHRVLCWRVRVLLMW